MRIRNEPEAQATWDRLNEEARTLQSKYDLVTYVTHWGNAMERAHDRKNDFLAIAEQVAQRATESPAKTAIFEEAADILAKVWDDREGDIFQQWNEVRKLSSTS